MSVYFDEFSCHVVQCAQLLIFDNFFTSLEQCEYVLNIKSFYLHMMVMINVGLRWCEDIQIREMGRVFPLSFCLFFQKTEVGRVRE